MTFTNTPINRKFKNGFFRFMIFMFISLTLMSCLDDIFKQHKYFLNANTALSKTDTSSLHFFVLSDWGFSGSEGQRKVAAEMSQISKLVGIQFILTCGDNFQIAGVESVNDSLWTTNYTTIYNDSALLVPWHPALGNHDHLGNPDAEVEYTTTSKYWKMPAKYYSFVEKVNARDSARFIVLDTQGLIQEYQNLSDTTDYETTPQYGWLKKLLSGKMEKWIIVTGHHPVFSAATFHGDTYEMKKLIKPLFDQYKVDFYICGHDHDFEHAKEKAEYTDYIVTGTGGNPRIEGRNERTIYSMSALGFTYFSITQDCANLYFITADGLIGYSYMKKKNIISRGQY